MEICSECMSSSLLYVVLNIFPHTGNLQQTTLKTANQKYRKSLQMMIELLNRVVANGKLAHYEQFSIFHIVF